MLLRFLFQWMSEFDGFEFSSKLCDVYPLIMGQSGFSVRYRSSNTLNPFRSPVYSLINFGMELNILAPATFMVLSLIDLILPTDPDNFGISTLSPYLDSFLVTIFILGTNLCIHFHIYRILYLSFLL